MNKPYLEEIWKDIIGYEGLYQVSNLGRVKSLPRKLIIGNNEYFTKMKILKPNILNGKRNKGYLIITIYKNGVKKCFLLHRLVAIHFILNPENKNTVNHKDGDKSNNKYSNLEWMSQGENAHHAFVNNLKSHNGIKNPFSKLTEKDVLEIRNSQETQKNIANKYNIHYSTVGYIKSGKLWKHLS